MNEPNEEGKVVHVHPNISPEQLTELLDGEFDVYCAELDGDIEAYNHLSPSLRNKLLGHLMRIQKYAVSRIRAEIMKTTKVKRIQEHSIKNRKEKT